mmetsp:Transcript_9087/g.30117  ORF Transcript_9087/g.30117 Transcript_9087/m.30117 type:complete len:222 (+) Transcript_9087:456-1121(+)
MHGTSASVHRLPQPTVMWSEFAHLGSRIERHLCSVARATDARRSMSCAHWYIGTLWVCRTLEGRVEDDIKEITRLVPLSDILKRPVAKPGDCVEPVAGEDVAAVQHAVVVAQKHVARLHRHGDDVLFGDLVDVLQHLARNQAQVPEIDVGHAHLGRTTWPPLAQEARLVVQVAEPDGPACFRVAVDWRLGLLHCLQPHRPAVSSPEHLKVHVELWGHRPVD